MRGSFKGSVRDREGFGVEGLGFPERWLGRCGLRCTVKTVGGKHPEVRHPIKSAQIQNKPAKNPSKSKKSAIDDAPKP